MADRITNEQREAIVREAVAKRDALLAGTPHYFCNKCGYSGPEQVSHQRPNGTGECGYMAALVPAGVPASAALTATPPKAEDLLDALFRENAIPMSDRNWRLHDTIRAALATRGAAAPVPASVMDDLMALVYLYGAHCAEHPEDSEGTKERLSAIKAFAAGVPAPAPAAPSGFPCHARQGWCSTPLACRDHGSCPHGVTPTDGGQQ